MDRGIDFLKSQINNAVMQHQSFVENLADHEKQAEDARFRDLCSRFLPKAQAHQRMLEDYQREIGAGDGRRKKGARQGARRRARSRRCGARERFPPPRWRHRRLASDRRTPSRPSGKRARRSALSRLQEIGDMGEREHDDFHREANRLVQQMFVEHVREGDTTGLNISPSSSAGFDATRTSTRTRPSSF